jgi:hypothetical protein
MGRALARAYGSTLGKGLPAGLTLGRSDAQGCQHQASGQTEAAQRLSHLRAKV